MTQLQKQVVKIDSLQTEYHVKHFPDPQEKKVRFCCSVTGNEIYEDECWLETSTGEVLRDDMQVLMEYAEVVRIASE